ncbi:hypothetical protein BHM03_00052817 [Ensete ventricosum]|nr:hypothetical protein BHM03_00052817 [Ensete ventricosum]
MSRSNTAVATTRRDDDYSLSIARALSLSWNIGFRQGGTGVRGGNGPSSERVEHSCINPKSLAFGYLDEKPIDTGLIKFFGLCHSALSWYLEFASAFSTSSAPFQPMLSLYESKGSMTPRKSYLCGTMALLSP